MNITPLKQKKSYIGVVGVPNSGTTLLSNCFHSAENAFCLSEPHLAFYDDETNRKLMLDKLNFKKINTILMNIVNSTDEIQDKKEMINSEIEKLPNFPVLSNGDIIFDISSINRKLHNFLENSNFLIGGIKECYWSKKTNPTCCFYKELLESKYVDTFIFIFREPRACYLSQIQKGYVSAEGFADDYNALYKEYESLNNKNKFLIIYESLCKYGISYLKYITKDYYNFNGELKFKPTIFGTGSWNTKGIRRNPNIDKLINPARVYDSFDKDFIKKERKNLDIIEHKLSDVLNNLEF